ncbi:MAG: hypothetical protein JPMHGGIA_02260 [Saprospiraceae bacterium]|nr:hypothetical protein [Saprospiraceae bacterium]
MEGFIKLLFLNRFCFDFSLNWKVVPEFFGLFIPHDL